MNDIITRYVKLPDTVHGFVCPDENGDYNIYINQNDPDERKRKAIIHERKHISYGCIC